jgi:hypothetical protein
VRKDLPDTWIHVGIFRVSWDNASAEGHCVIVLNKEAMLEPRRTLDAAYNYLLPRQSFID